MPRNATKILAKMRQSRKGWRAHEFHTLYLGFGFNIIHGAKHDTFYHPDFPEIRDQIPRHADELSPGYASDAVENIDKLQRLIEERENKKG